MQLTQQQLDQFHEEGYFFIPDAFSPEEVAVLRDAAADVFGKPRPEIWLEKSGAPRTAFACHTYNDVFRTLAHHPRLVEPVARSSASLAMSTSSRSTPKAPSPAMCGNGTRITAPGSMTTACPSPAR